MTVLFVCRCGKVVERKPCPDCKRKDNQRRKQKNVEQGKTGRRWDAIRAAVLRRDQACVRCGSTARLSAHRIGGGFHDWDLMQYETLCAFCHGREDATARGRGGIAS
jgi:5-methylcytosine-specific restriction endonuclease McrA